MLKFRTLMRKEVLEVNNVDKLTPKERLLYGLKWALEHSERAKLKKDMQVEKTMIMQTKQVRILTTFLLKQINNYFYKREDISQFCVLVDKKFENIIQLVINQKDFLGVKIELGYVNPVALKIIPNIRIPLIFTKEVI